MNKLNLLVRGIKNPVKAVRYIFSLINNRLNSWEFFNTFRMHRALGISRKTIYAFYKEIYADKAFWKYLNEKIDEAKKTEPKVGGWIDFSLLPYIYVLVRIFKPRVVVETGVGPGSSSAFVLNALEKNGSGILYSIDLPGYDAVVYPKLGKHHDVHICEGFSTGWLVPPNLRHRWNLILGDTKEILPKLLRELGVIDMFLHDSLHTYEHMMFEYTTAWEYLSKGGLLLSDDVNEYWSLAFIDFCKSKKVPYCVLSNRLGITKKLS